MMHFITLAKFRNKPTKENIEENKKKMEIEAKEGVKYLGIYYTLGRYDAIMIFEAPNEKVAMKTAIRRGDVLAQETLVAIPAEEARKLVA